MKSFYDAIKDVLLTLLVLVLVCSAVARVPASGWIAVLREQVTGTTGHSTESS
jgi:hypothetical protein